MDAEHSVPPLLCRRTAIPILEALSFPQVPRAELPAPWDRLRTEGGEASGLLDLSAILLWV